IEREGVTRAGTICRQHQARAQGGICERIENGIRRSSQHLAAIIDRDGVTRISTERAEIDDLPLLPNNATHLRDTSQRIDRAVLCLADNRPAIIDPVRETALPAGYCSEIGNYTVPPHESVENETV